ncbi:Bug family tripartite tricarboxylate transporter substrate binding protein [Tardiphaga sp. 866_E4_N2_1]|uniref:Bug family tripartite tricarboxylate transporter substrate binding protein n=1 Tax=unclassified Tardiphaga TaxID=2631404 RepID=UPI003F27C780
MNRWTARRITRRTLLETSVAVLVGQTAPAFAQKSYPTKPINIVVPFPAGSVADAIARQFGQFLSSRTNGTAIIENKAGAGGMIGTAAVARAAPDGYVLVATTNTTHSAVEALFKKVAYDPVTDFSHIAAVARVPTVVCVKADSSFQSIEAVVRFAKDNPGKIEYGHGNSSGQILGETLKTANNINIVRVSYRGVPQVLTDVLGDQIKVAIIDLASALPLINSGALRCLAVSTAAPSPLLPDVPSLNDTVIPGYDLTPWFGFAGPAGLLTEVTATLGSRLEAFANDVEVRKRMSDLSVDIRWVAPGQINEFVRDERDKWLRSVRAAGISPE